MSGARSQYAGFGGRTDRAVKLETYRRCGVPHVWLIEPTRPVMVEELVLGESGRYELNAVVVGPAEWSPLAIPGWRLSLAELDEAVVEVEDEEPPAGA